jgi:hypothetical protein
MYVVLTRMYFSWNSFPLKEKARNAAALSILAKPPPPGQLFCLMSGASFKLVERSGSLLALGDADVRGQVKVKSVPYIYSMSLRVCSNDSTAKVFFLGFHFQDLRTKVTFQSSLSKRCA